MPAALLLVACLAARCSGLVANTRAVRPRARGARAADPGVSAAKAAAPEAAAAVAAQEAAAAALAPAAALAARWSLSLNVGREGGTWMPAEWAASGARLLLKVAVEFDAAPYGGAAEPLLGRSAFSVRPIGVATFVGPKGTTEVPIGCGGWSLQPPKRGERPALLRFFLDFPAGAARNDVTIPAGRVFFSSPAWQQPEIEGGLVYWQSAKDQLAAAAAALVAAPDGTPGVFGRAGQFRDKVNLVEARDAALSRFDRIRSLMPEDPRATGRAGSWPGLLSNSSFTLGGGGLVVKKRGRLLFGAEYHILGKFEPAPMQ
ncbi:hypothetical protein M885DRAFT_591333 [Pelagophyceae sp. CCMP2097]|nr:hypothetical protein M885DRAFT_591333 [Pelagophyceae sp. CCMP2097]